MQVAVHPQAYAGALLVLFDVQVTGAVTDRIEQERIAPGDGVGLDADLLPAQEVLSLLLFPALRDRAPQLLGISLQR
jgi:hypothetical protein